MKRADGFPSASGDFENAMAADFLPFFDCLFLLRIEFREFVFFYRQGQIIHGYIQWNRFPPFG